MTKPTLTQERLKELLHYEPETGIFTWLVRSANCIQIGDIAGNLTSHGYIEIMIDRRKYYAHRLAFLYMEGKLPIDETDHDNRIRSDNRWENLNQATHTMNMRNQSRRSDNTSGHAGVYWHKGSSKWMARININGKLKYLGIFTDIADAIAVRKLADIKYSFHPHHGK